VDVLIRFFDFPVEGDENITPLDTNDTPPLDIQGAITRARAR
jgi:hypothetical protein